MALIAVSLWGQASGLFELTGKRALVAEAAGEGHFAERLASGGKEEARFLDPGAQDVLFGGEAEVAFEALTNLKGR